MSITSSHRHVSHATFNSNKSSTKAKIKKSIQFTKMEKNSSLSSSSIRSHANGLLCLMCSHCRMFSVLFERVETRLVITRITSHLTWRLRNPELFEIDQLRVADRRMIFFMADGQWWIWRRNYCSHFSSSYFLFLISYFGSDQHYIRIPRATSATHRTPISS